MSSVSQRQLCIEQTRSATMCARCSTNETLRGQCPIGELIASFWIQANCVRLHRAASMAPAPCSRKAIVSIWKRGLRRAIYDELC